MNNSSNDIHSYSAFNLNVDSRDKILLRDTEDFIKSNIIEIKAVSNMKEKQEFDSENYMNHKHTDELKPLTNALFEEENEFKLNSRYSNKILNKSDIKSERNKSHSQFYEQYNKQTRYIPVEPVVNTNYKNAFEIIDLGNDKDKKTNGKAHLHPNKNSNAKFIEENNAMQEIFNQAEILIGIPKQIESIETNRGENHLNLDENQHIILSDSTFENKNFENITKSQGIEDINLENSLMVPSKMNPADDGNIKTPIALNIKDNPIRPNSTNPNKENSNSRVQCCRICYEEESDEKGGLIYPCNCTGSCQYIHESCLKKWIENNLMDNKVKAECEICKHEYIMKFYIKWKFNKQKLFNTFKSLLSAVLVTSIILALVFTVVFVVVTALSVMTEREKKNFINILAGVGGGVLIIIIILSLRKWRKCFYEQHICDWRIFNVDGSKNKI